VNFFKVSQAILIFIPYQMYMKPGHTEPSDWSAAKKTEDGYQGKGWSCCTKIKIAWETSKKFTL